jgi:hypothetical protein
MDSLSAAMNDVADLHFKARAAAIQRKYDMETKHGRDSLMQKNWSDTMSKCVGDESCTEINGLLI